MYKCLHSHLDESFQVLSTSTYYFVYSTSVYKGRESNIGLNLVGKKFENGRWMELAQGRVQWRALVLAVLKLRVLLPES
jgi:hypothetical protein